MKKILLIISILASLFIQDVHAENYSYSMNKYKEEKFKFIIDSYKENKKDGYITAGEILKEVVEVDEDEYNDYQIILSKYNKNGKVKWNFIYGKTTEDYVDSLTYTYDEENNINGYLIVMKKTYNIEDKKTNNSVFVKIDLDGNLVEEKETNLKENYIITNIKPIKNIDNTINYIAIGINNNIPFIAKYDQNLNLITEKDYNNNYSVFKDLIIINNKIIISLKENKINKVISYDLDTSEIKEIYTSNYEKDNVKLLELDNGFIIYGYTKDVKLKNEKSKSYYLNRYDYEYNLVWDTIGNVPIKIDKPIKLIKDNSDLLLMYTNSTDKTIEVDTFDLEGVFIIKIKKVNDEYYDINDYAYSNKVLYFIGQIKCPEDETCEYDSKSLFLISTEDKVIEVKEKDGTIISIVFAGIIFILGLLIAIKKKKKL